MWIRAESAFGSLVNYYWFNFKRRYISSSYPARGQQQYLIHRIKRPLAYYSQFDGMIGIGSDAKWFSKIDSKITYTSSVDFVLAVDVMVNERHLQSWLKRRKRERQIIERFNMNQGQGREMQGAWYALRSKAEMEACTGNFTVTLLWLRVNSDMMSINLNASLTVARSRGNWSSMPIDFWII